MLPPLCPSLKLPQEAGKEAARTEQGTLRHPAPILGEQGPLDEPLLSSALNTLDTNLFTQNMTCAVASQQDEEI